MMCHSYKKVFDLKSSDLSQPQRKGFSNPILG
jgi:hypothetical protein